jgi:TDG/mug DNA glycosylase family protein
VAGWRVLEAKIDKYRPAFLALVGVTVFRAVLPLIVDAGATPAARPASSPKVRGAGTPRTRSGREAAIGLQPYAVHGARVFVLPNPSGRNANFSYPEMLAAFRALRRLTHPRS